MCNRALNFFVGTLYANCMIDTHRPTLLIVDDSPENLFVLSELLQSHYRVLAANNGERGLRVARTEPRPDLILLDVMMPKMSGFEVCQKIKQNPDLRDTVIIMVTGQADKSSIVACAKLGVHGYIVKPFVNKELAPKIVKIYRESQKNS